GSIGYLPQDTRSGDLDQRARERVLSARDLDGIRRRLKRAEIEMGSEHEGKRIRAMDRYARLDAEFTALGGWAADAEAAKITANLGLHTTRSEEHTSELQSRFDLVCRLLIEKKKEEKEEIIIV